MKKSRDFFIEDLLEETKKEIEKLEKMDNILFSEGDIIDSQVALEVRRRFSEEDIEGIDFKVDGYMELMVSEDEMKAEADFFPPSEGMKPLSPETVEKIIEEHGITHGLDWEAVHEAVFKCNTELIPVKGVTVARGKRPIKEVPAHYIIEEHLLETNSGISRENKERVDFRDISPFVLVHEGDILARLAPQQEGSFGTTILGKDIPYAVEKKREIEAGKNTKMTNGIIIATCDGRFESRNNEFWINEVLNIEGDVDYSTGNVDFPGDVVLKGQIKDGFRIRAGGSIYASQTIDASEVVCDKNLIVKQGIIGRKKGSIKIEGMLKAKFIENCYIEAKKSIFLDAGIINSAVYTCDKIELGKKGVIVGGTIYAQNGVKATQIGTKMGPQTSIYCGIDYTVANKLKWIQDNNIKLASKLKQVNEELYKSKTEDPALVQLQDKIKGSIHKLNETAFGLLNKLDRNDNARVEVTGTVYPGVYIEICHISYVVGREISKVVFTLNKEKGLISIDRLLLTGTKNG
ncbi:MAG: DUF342 domain-containing protein [Spirochaetales bacterium]|nr:DUF342 domain-containing protein [Spirochaetales bacterium]